MRSDLESISQRDAALYLLKLKQSSNSFPGFMSYYYDYTWEAFQKEMQEILDKLEKDALVTAGGNPIRNVLLTLPPRHAKSFNSTINFPAYCLMRKPSREVMVSSYNNDLASTFGRATRDIVMDQKARKAFKGFDLSKETRAVDFWKTTAGGAYYSVGLNGTTTGRGVNCLPGDTELLVTTGRGATYATRIDDIVLNQKDVYVLSYDHATDSPAWGRVHAYSETATRELFEIRDSSGGVIEATGEHPFYVVGRGYVQAQDIATGDVLMRVLPEDIDQAGFRDPEAHQAWTQGYVLLSGVQHEASLYEEESSLRRVWTTSEAQQREKVLQHGVQRGTREAEAGASYTPVQAVPQGVHVKTEDDSVLLDGLQEYAPFAIDGCGEQPEAHTRILRAQEAATHDQGVYESKAKDQSEGRNEVRCVSVGQEPACSPHRPQPAQLHLEQSGDSVCFLSSQTPRLREEDRSVTVSMVTRVCRECLVYNISVEHYENFFANGILTHNCLFIDDPYKSREEADSVIQRRKVWNFYTSGLLSRRQPDRDGQPAFQIVTQTRWHPDDMAGRIMDSEEFKRGEWIHVNYQALTKKERGVYVTRNKLPKDHPGYVPNVTVSQIATGERGNGRGIVSGENVNKQANVADIEVALWPKRFPVSWLRQQKVTLGDREFEALYQQNPYILGGNIIKENWFRKYKFSEMPEFHALAIGVDTAFKKAQHNDYSVFTVAGITEMGDIYIMAVFREKLEFPDLKRKAININVAYRGKGLRGFWVEDNASGQSLIQELRNSSGVSVIPWKPGAADKVLRAQGITPLIEAGRVFIPDEAEWLDEWINELASFPSSKHDDQVDSLVIVLDVLSRMVVTGMREFSSPIGDIVSQEGLKGLLFAGQELRSDPGGWQGSGGIGKSLVGLSDAFGGGDRWQGWGL